MSSTETKYVITVQEHRSRPSVEEVVDTWYVTHDPYPAPGGDLRDRLGCHGEYVREHDSEDEAAAYVEELKAELVEECGVTEDQIVTDWQH